MNTIKWQFTNNNISESDIHKIEDMINVKLPKEYVECVLLNNAGYPDKNIYDTEKEVKKVFDHLLSISEEDCENVLAVKDDIKKENIIPFGTDPFGNYLCFRYKDNVNYDIIFLDNDDENEIYICDSFLEFTNKLYII